MKKIALLMVAAFLMGGMAMAQQARRGDKMPNPKVRAERMTERMTKEYSLNETQKKQLLEANMALVEKMGDRPMHRRPDMKQGKAGCDSCTYAKAGKHHRKDARMGKKKGERPQLTDEQRAQKKAGMEKRHEEMQTARAAYDAQLQKIMTKEQYAAYSKNMKERKDHMASGKKDVRKK